MEELFDFPIMKSGVDELVADIIKSNYDNRRLIINDEINNNLFFFKQKTAYEMPK